MSISCSRSSTPAAAASTHSRPWLSITARASELRDTQASEQMRQAPTCSKPAQAQPHIDSGGYWQASHAVHISHAVHDNSSPWQCSCEQSACVCCAVSPVALSSARLLQQHCWTSCTPLANSSTHAPPAAETAAASRQPARILAATFVSQDVTHSGTTVSIRWLAKQCHSDVVWTPLLLSASLLLQSCTYALLLCRTAELHTCRVPRQQH